MGLVPSHFVLAALRVSHRLGSLNLKALILGSLLCIAGCSDEPTPEPAITFQSDETTNFVDTTSTATDLLGRNRIKFFAASPDLKTFAALSTRVKNVAGQSENNVIEVFNFATGAPLKRLSTGFGVDHLSFSPRGDYLLAQGADKEIRVWTTSDFELSRKYSAVEDARASRAEFTFDSERILDARGSRMAEIVTLSGQTTLWRMDSGFVPFALACSPVTPLRVLGQSSEAPEGRVHELRIHSRSIAEASDQKISIPNKNPRLLAFSGDGQRLVVACLDGELLVYDTSNWTLLHQLVRPNGELPSTKSYKKVSVSRNGDYIAVIPMYGQSRDHFLELWNVASQKVQKVGEPGCTDLQFLTDNVFCVSDPERPLAFFDATNATSVSPPTVQTLAIGSLPVAEPEFANIAEKVRHLRRTRQFDKAVALARETLGPDLQAAIVSGQGDLIRELAAVHRSQGDALLAASTLRVLVDATEASLAAETLEFGDELERLCVDLFEADDFQGCRDLITSVLEQRTARFGADHLSVADALWLSGRSHEMLGQTNEALVDFETCLALRRANSNCPRLDMARAILWCGEIDRQQGEYERAITRLLEAIEMLESTPAAVPNEVAAAKLRLSQTYREMGDPVLGEQITVELDPQAEPDQPHTITLMTSLAQSRAAAGLFNESEALSRQAIDAIRLEYGPHSLQLLHLYFQMAMAYDRVGMFDNAVQSSRLALSEYEARFGPDFPQKKTLMLVLGHALVNRDSTRNEGLLVLEKASSIKAPRTPAGRLAATETEFLLAFRRYRGDSSRDTLFGLDRAMRAFQDVLQHSLRQLPDRMKYREASRYWSVLDRTWTMAADHHQDKEWVSKSAEWVINSKGLSAATIAEEAAMLRTSQSPEARPKAEELQRVRRQLTALAMRADRGYWTEESDGEVTELLREEIRLSSELAANSATLQHDHSWIELDQLRESLDPNTVVVEFVRYRKLDPTGKYMFGEFYAAWVIPPFGKGNVQVVPMGRADELDSYISQTQFAIRNDHSMLMPALGGPSSPGPTPASQLIAILSTLLIEPLENHLDPFTRWVICPDGQTWFVPWSGLLESDGTHVVERRDVVCLTSSRQWLEHQAIGVSGQAKTGIAAIFAAPDYDANAQLGRGGLPFRHLQGTAQEAAAVEPSLAALTGQAVEMRTGAEATEEAMRGLHAPRVLLLSTHGYYADGNDDLDPLVRSGVALAGANEAYAASIEFAEIQDRDGLLTGLEAAALDLAGSELVFLNACETGQGMEFPGEGVAGLHHAFHTAGARQVVSTLWPIADKESAELSAWFFENLARGDNVETALRSAQRRMIDKLKQELGHAPLRIWAPFRISGIGARTASDLSSSNTPSYEPRFLVNSIGMALARIPAGSFEMGSPVTEQGRADDEILHTVSFNHSYHLSRHEVTQGQYQLIMEANPAAFSTSGSDRERVRRVDTRNFPIENVTWTEANEFCEKLSQLPSEIGAGRTYRLPTEAEWEYACRAGTNTPFCFGDSLGADQANFDGQQPYGDAVPQDSLKQPVFVGMYRCNRFGLYDTHGNVWEWCSDWYGPYSNQAVSHPTGAEKGERRVIRGSCFFLGAAPARSAMRNSEPPTYKAPNVGFRVVCEIRE